MKALKMLALVLLLSACSGGALSLLTGGGPNVAANTQLGQNNEQVLGVRKSSDQSIVRPQARDIRQSSDTSSVRSENVDNVSVTNIPPWVLLLLILGWLLPSPGEMGRTVKSWSRK